MNHARALARGSFGYAVLFLWWALPAHATFTTERRIEFVRANFHVLSDCKPIPGTIEFERRSGELEIYVTYGVRLKCVRDGKMFRAEACLEEDGRRQMNWVIDIARGGANPTGVTLTPL